MNCEARSRLYRRRRRIAVVALIAFAIQGVAGGSHALALFAGAQAAEAGGFAFLVICTPQGIKKIAPDGTPWEDDGQDLPASAALDACQVCCSTVCGGLLARSDSTTAAGWTGTASRGIRSAPFARTLFQPAPPGRGPPHLV